MTHLKYLMAVRRECVIWAAIPLLLLVCTVPQVSFAFAEREPIAAMVAKVSPAVVRVFTVRPPTPAVNKPGTSAAEGAPDDGPSMAFGSGTSLIRPAISAPTNMWLTAPFRYS